MAGEIATRAHESEFGFGQTGLDRSYPNAGTVEIAAQSEGKLPHESLGRAVDVAARIRIAASN